MIAPNAATAAASGDRPAQRPNMRLVSGKPLVKGSLRGFATIELPIWLRTFDCPVYIGAMGAWARLAAKAQLDRQGRQRARPCGKLAYSTVREWRSRDLANRFSEAIVGLIGANTLDGSG
jgi:hypothetical protein